MVCRRLRCDPNVAPGSELQFRTPGLPCRICSALWSPQPWSQGGSSYSREGCSEEDQGELSTMTGMTELPEKVCPHQPQHRGRMPCFCVALFLKESGLWYRVRVGFKWPGRKCVRTVGPYAPLPWNHLCQWGPCKASRFTWMSRSEAQAQFKRSSLIILHNLDGGAKPCQMENLQLHFGEAVEELSDTNQISKFGSTNI